MAERITRDDATDAEWGRAATIARVLGPLVGRTSRSRADVDRAAAELGISTSSAYAYLTKLSKDARPTALLGRRPGPERGQPQLDQRVEELISLALKQVYCSSQKPTEAAVLKTIRGRCIDAGLERPSRKAIHARIEALELYERLRAREGENAAEVAAPRPGGLQADRPNQIWLIDHTLADIILVDRRYRLPLGRPTLTLIIDAYTRMCVGCYASLGAPSIIQTAMALMRAFLPKDALLESAGQAWSWPCHGFPEILHSDNGADFRSLAIQRGLSEFSIQTMYRPIRQPRFGALIERFIGTMMGELHLLPGTTFSNVDQRGDYDSDRKAVMTLDAFEEWLFLQVAQYHGSPHRGLDGFTPHSRWTEMVGEGFSPRAVPVGHSQDLLIAFLPSIKRRLGRAGIMFRKLRYWAAWFGPLIRQGRFTVDVRYDPRDLSFIWVLAPTGWERVHLYRRQEPFTLREHELALADQRGKAKATHDEEAMHELRKTSELVVRDETRASRRLRRQVEHAERSIEASQGVFGPSDPRFQISDQFKVALSGPRQEVEEW